MPEMTQDSFSEEKHQVFPFDLFTDLIGCFSNQVIHCIIQFDDRIRYDILKMAVSKASRVEPVLQCRIFRDQDSLWWQEVKTWDSDQQVLLLSSQCPRESLYQALSFPLDPYMGMLFQVVLIENKSNDGDILVINAHHVVMDGRGLKDFAGLIITLYTNYLTGNRADVKTNPLINRRYPDFSAAFRSTIQDCQPSPPFGWCSRISVPLQSLHVESYLYSLLTFSQNRTAIIQKTRKEWNITVNDLMVAVIARAIASVLGLDSETTIPLYNTIDLRRYLSDIPGRSLVNLSTSFETGIAVNPDESLEETARRVHLLMNQVKERSPGLDEAMRAEELSKSGYLAAKEIISRQWNSILQSGSKTTIFSNTGIIRTFSNNSGVCPVRNAFLLPGHFHPPGFFFLLSTFEDIMTLSASYAQPAYDCDLVNRIFAIIDSCIPGFVRCPGKYEVIGSLFDHR
jgi:NRPS condensation-like uncharacterized protein